MGIFHILDTPEGINRLFNSNDLPPSSYTNMRKKILRLKNESANFCAIEEHFVANPKIIVLDKATSKFVTESEALIQKSPSELVKDHTTFSIAHRLNTIKKTDQILVTESGRIAKQKTHEDLITKKGRYYDLYIYQAKI